MDIVTLSMWGISLPLMIYSYLKKRGKTKEATHKAKGMMQGMLPDIIAIIFLIGFVLSLLTPATIAETLSKVNPFTGTLFAALIGCVTLIPAFVAFPLVGSLIEGGAHLVPSVAFLTTLTMVGIKTFPLEAKEFGIKFTLLRSLLSFVLALLVAFIMGGLM
ncbi:Predicted permease [Natronincola peptidivorans]|uniref:Predicted permease n=1 Tax=Natronincola peptidivorans TaxID=426128 RepID=A0A1I0C6F7_9FIRM|nr:permease [Natronincola peptidivorans]SET14947.1 Predicted permease [Natronincola peptidivorans]